MRRAQVRRTAASIQHGGTKMFERIQRSIELTKTSWHLLMKDKELAVLPVISGILILGITALFLVPIVLVMSNGASGSEDPERTFWPLMIPMYVAIYSADDSLPACPARRRRRGSHRAPRARRGAARLPT
jgi:hypothetical protein